MATPDPNKASKELEQVKRDAEYLFKKRDRERREDEAYKLASESGEPLPGQGETFDPKEDKKGKQ